MMRKTSFLLALLLAASFVTPMFAADDEQDIRTLTDEFCKAILAKNLDAIDHIFDPDPSNIYWDINEGPLVGIPNLKRVWRAATTNYTISKFNFRPDMKVYVKGTEAFQTGTWEQTQVANSGTERNIIGRATILWKKTPNGWRVYHYHASITPRGR